MKRVMITLDDDLARWVHLEAARRKVPPSHLLADLVARAKARSEADDEAMSRFLAVEPRPLGTRPSRDEIHRRP